MADAVPGLLGVLARGTASCSRSFPALLCLRWWPSTPEAVVMMLRRGVSGHAWAAVRSREPMQAAHMQMAQVCCVLSVWPG